MLRSRSTAITELLPEIRAASKKVRPSNAFPAGPVITFRYCSEYTPSGKSLFVMYTTVWLSRSHNGFCASSTTGSFPGFNIRP